MRKVVLAAGASSGLGRAVAQGLAEAGMLVYVGARSFETGTPPPEGCLPIALDVTSEASVNEAISRIVAEQGGLDALVNCAAQIMLGACEEVSEAELRAVMDVNFLGAARLIRAALPHLRARGGRIVQFSSINGLLGIPFQGAYVASKHALEGYCESLAQEVRPFGVRVTLVEPGDCRGGSARYRMRAERAEKPESPYAARFAKVVYRIARDENGGLDPTRVAKAVLRLLESPRPPARAVVARADQRFAALLHRLTPGNAFNRLMERYYCGKPIE